ncbi:MAG: methyltransferase [Nanoarchaeota archaeon]|nr:methyltransferase [Nanoarchaeota archaeon]
MDVYEPREDSELLRKYVRKYAKGAVLDMGTGSGIQAEEAVKKTNVKKVVAVDINPEVKKYITNQKIKVVISDLFSRVKGKYDLIIFNPPYLPEDSGIEDAALYGGKQGYEILVRFLESVNDYLEDDGKVLVVFSNLTQKDMVDMSIERNLLDFKLLDSMKLPLFEVLYCYLITKSEVLKHLNKKKVTDIEYLAHGKRGMVFTGDYRGKKIAVKVKKKSSEAVDRIKNESLWLERLNKVGIGPKLLFHNENFLAYEFVSGEFIMDFFSRASKARQKKVLKDVFMQCFMMDELRINKEEMHHPLKHVLVDYPRVTLLDFERVYYTKNPHNVTQFVQFVSNVLKLDKRKMRILAKRYKDEMTLKNLKAILKEIK